MDFLTLHAFDRMGAVATVLAFALAIITDKLVWHTRLKNAEARADRWEQVAVNALTAGAQAGVRAAETTVGIVGALPDPQLLRDRARAAAEAVLLEAEAAGQRVTNTAAAAAAALPDRGA